MKKVIFLTVAFVAIAFTKHAFAQAETSIEEKKNKVVMTLVNDGKAVSTEINSVNVSMSRYEDSYDEEQVPKVKPAGTDTAKAILLKGLSKRANGISYLSIEAKSLTKDMMQVLAKSKNRFNGSITITDPATKKVLRNLKFTGGALYSYSDQLTSLNESYGYGSTVLSISCKGLSIDGVNFD